MDLRNLPSLAKDAVKEWSEDKATRHAASLSYYTIFSLAPLLIISIAVAGAVFGEEAARGQIVGQIGGLIGKQGAEAVQTMIENASQPKEGGFAALLGVAALIFGASGVFGQLQDSLNAIWEVRPKPGKGIKGFLKSRFLSFSMVLVIAFLLLVSLVLTTALTALGSFLGGFLPEQELLLRAADLLIAFGVVTVLFAAIFKFLPDAKIAWGDVWIGALVTALLFTLGRFLIGLYLGRSAASSAYGAAGSLVIVLLWVYYSSQILFFGAEFTQVYASRFGTRVVPAGDAEAVTKPLPREGKPALEPSAARTAPSGTREPARDNAPSGTREGSGTEGIPARRPAKPGKSRFGLSPRKTGMGSAAVALALAFLTAGSALSQVLGRLRHRTRRPSWS